MKHYIKDGENLNVEFETFNAKEMTNLIINHLKANPQAMVKHSKEFAPHLKKKYYGNEVIDIYEVNPKTGEPSKVITKGNITLYKTLEL
jgi:hypothetical protein